MRPACSTHYACLARYALEACSPPLSTTRPAAQLLALPGLFTCYFLRDPLPCEATRLDAVDLRSLALDTSDLRAAHRRHPPSTRTTTHFRAAQVTYEPIGNASLRERCWTLATAAVSLVLVIVAAEF